MKDRGVDGWMDGRIREREGERGEKRETEREREGVGKEKIEYSQTYLNTKISNAQRKFYPRKTTSSKLLLTILQLETK